MNRDYRQIVDFLSGVRRRVWVAGFVSASLKAGVVAAVAATVNLLVAEGETAWPWVAFILALAGTLAFYGALARAAAALFGPPSLLRTGRRVERAQKDFRDDIVSSLEVGGVLDGRAGEKNFSQPLAEALLATTREALEHCRPSQFVSWRGALVWGSRLAVVLLPLALFLAAGGKTTAGPFRALVDPTVYSPLFKVGFAVEPGSARVVAGSDLEVEARLTGSRRATAMLAIDGPGEVLRKSLTGGGEGIFRGGLKDLRESFRYRVEAAGSASPWYDVDVIMPPRAGSFEARFTYPAYTGLPERHQALNGDLEVLRGTEVELSFAVTGSLARGKVFLGDTVYETAPLATGRHGATFYLNGEEFYHLELTDDEGFTDPDPAGYGITYIVDEMPTAEIVTPVGEVLFGMFANIPIIFRSGDDFGLSRLLLVYRDSSGRETREQVPLAGGGRKVEGEYLWDAAAVDAPPGSRVEVFLEALDNDTITGPKAARSNSFTLLVPDLDEEHRKTGELLEELIDSLVDTLADELDLLGRYEEQEAGFEGEWDDYPWEEYEAAEELRKTLEEGAPELAAKMESLMAQMSADPMSRPESFFQLERIASQLNTMDRMSREPRGDVARSIERDEVVREEMEQKAAFMEKYTEEAVAALEQMILQAEEMQRERNLADIRNAGDEMLELQDRLLNKLEDLATADQEAMKEVLDALADLEAMMRDLMESLAKENRLLPEEFLNSDALEELPLSDIMKGLDEIRRKLAAGDMEGARQAAREMLRKIADLMNRLQQAGEDFRRSSRQALNRLKNSTIPEIERLIGEQKRILEETESLEEEVRRRDPDPDGDGKPPDPSHLLRQEEKEELSQLAEEEGALSEDSSALAEEAAALKAALPFLDPAVESDLRISAEEMEEAGGELAGNRPGGAVPSERNALAALMKARDGARQSLQAMEQMQGLREGKGGMGLFQRPSPGGRMSSMPRTGEETGGRMGASVRGFRLPGKEDYSVPPFFRQEILKSLREGGYPEGYEGRIRDYFHRITE